MKYHYIDYKKNTFQLLVDVSCALKTLSENDSIQRKKRWSQDEHLLFLIGLKYHGRDYKKISLYYVKTRSSSQIRSHAQKYFNRNK